MFLYIFTVVLLICVKAIKEYITISSQKKTSMSTNKPAPINLSKDQNTRRKLSGRVPKPEQWEKNIIGEFVLNLYHRSIITHRNDWCVEKSVIHKEYSQLIDAEQKKNLATCYRANDIGTFLRCSGFLYNNKKGASFYKIKFTRLFEYRNNKLKQLDHLQLNSDDKKVINLAKDEEDIWEIDENEEKQVLQYQGTIIKRRKDNFSPTDLSCCICQEDFSTEDLFQSHVQTHNDETDFEFLNQRLITHENVFTMSYRLCSDSDMFCFEFETDVKSIVIDKIIIVQTRSFFYVNNKRVPYKCSENGINRFFVNSHLFTINVVQPVILIFHYEDNEMTHIIEQHHFMRSEEFPINPNSRLLNKKFQQLTFLPDYFPPQEIYNALKDDFYYDYLIKESNAFRDYISDGRKLQPHTIAEVLNLLLQIEDVETIKQYLNLTQENIKINACQDRYHFKVRQKNGIFLENVLSPYDEVILTKNKSIFTKNKMDEKKIIDLIMKNSVETKSLPNIFIGKVQAISSGRVTFNCEKCINRDDSYDVIFKPSRFNIRYQFRSLQLLTNNTNRNISGLKKFLFPNNVIIPRILAPTSRLNFYNERLNPEQKQAVCNITEGRGNDATYILYGPPGTGKTATLVECILQILEKPDTKILVTASSNSACDEVALRLCKHMKELNIKSSMMRVYSRSCETSVQKIDKELLKKSNIYGGHCFPNVESLHEYRVLICTLSIVGRLATGYFGLQGFKMVYTHLFIDEIAATTETEALVAITAILSTNGSLIISGDHKQLGPILQSKRAEELGLGSSLMDRLLARDCYRVYNDAGNYDRTIQTRLVQNYRSHPAIVNLFSGLYYNNSLIAQAKPENVSLCKIWHKSRNMEYPIMFHSVYERSLCDRQSHSLYNMRELNVVMDYVKDFMYFGINGQPVQETDIGIVTPYKKQYKLIQEELNLRKWFGIETGSVETFQGKEKNIIIVSFVRSATNTLGFLNSPRRLNVTISRAKSLLILIGNPKTLRLNSEFDYIIKECQRNKTFIGSNATFKDGQIEQSTENLTKTMTKLGIENTHQAKTFMGSKVSREKEQKDNLNVPSLLDLKISNPLLESVNTEELLQKNNARRGRPNNIAKYMDNKDNNENIKDSDNDENQGDGDEKTLNKTASLNVFDATLSEREKNQRVGNLGTNQNRSLIDSATKISTQSNKKYPIDQLLDLRRQQQQYDKYNIDLPTKIVNDILNKNHRKPTEDNNDSVPESKDNLNRISTEINKDVNKRDNNEDGDVLHKSQNKTVLTTKEKTVFDATLSEREKNQRVGNLGTNQNRSLIDSATKISTQSNKKYPIDQLLDLRRQQQQYDKYNIDLPTKIVNDILNKNHRKPTEDNNDSVPESKDNLNRISTEINKDVNKRDNNEDGDVLHKSQNKTVLTTKEKTVNMIKRSHEAENIPSQTTTKPSSIFTFIQHQQQNHNSYNLSTKTPSVDFSPSAPEWNEEEQIQNCNLIVYQESLHFTPSYAWAHNPTYMDYQNLSCFKNYNIEEHNAAKNYNINSTLGIKKIDEEKLECPSKVLITDKTVKSACDENLITNRSTLKQKPSANVYPIMRHDALIQLPKNSNIVDYNSYTKISTKGSISSTDDIEICKEASDELNNSKTEQIKTKKEKFVKEKKSCVIS